jgi:DNA-binding transcriptional ArsR family regulator
MRALAHPARYAILEYLLGGGSGTATELGKVVELSPSATSYHLRAMAKVGLIVEAPSRGDGRERVWQSAGRGLNIETGPDATEEDRRAEQELTMMLVDRQYARTREWIKNVADEPHEWYGASSVSEMHPVLTAEELSELNNQVYALFRPYARTNRPDPPEGARDVTIIYRSFPQIPD